jgi:hypothetical protein
MNTQIASPPIKRALLQAISIGVAPIIMAVVMNLTGEWLHQATLFFFYAAGFTTILTIWARHLQGHKLLPKNRR